MIRTTLPTFYDALVKQVVQAVQTVEPQISGKSGEISLAIHLHEGKIRVVEVSAATKRKVDEPHEPI